MRQTGEFEFNAEIWLYPGKGGWHFVTLPQDVARQIRVTAEPKARGWGSEPVIARTGKTEWTTSIFPRQGLGLVSPAGQGGGSAAGEACGRPDDPDRVDAG